MSHWFLIVAMLAGVAGEGVLIFGKSDPVAYGLFTVALIELLFGMFTTALGMNLGGRE